MRQPLMLNIYVVQLYGIIELLQSRRNAELEESWELGVAAASRSDLTCCSEVG